MKNLIFAIVGLLVFPVVSEAKVLFEGITQDATQLEVGLNQNILGKKKITFNGLDFKVIRSAQNVNVAVIDPDQDTSNQLILITGTKEEVEQGVDRLFWGQTLNKTVLLGKVVAQALIGACNADLFTGLLFEFSQPNTIGKVVCLK